MEVKSVSIGIQARSTSERLPRKVHMDVGGKPVLQHVIDSAKQCARYLNKNTNRSGILVNVALLIPEGDEIKNKFRDVPIIEGSEKDVLSRYRQLAEKFHSDYIVRLTGDCVLLPSQVIAVHINRCVHNNRDYVSNVFPEFRTFPDGHDVEIFSKRVLEWLCSQSLSVEDKEHVTTAIRKSPPSWCSFGHVFHYLDLSSLKELKLSVDTLEDLENVRQHYASLRAAFECAERLHGRHSIFRF